MAAVQNPIQQAMANASSTEMRAREDAVRQQQVAAGRQPMQGQPRQYMGPQMPQAQPRQYVGPQPLQGQPRQYVGPAMGQQQGGYGQQFSPEAMQQFFQMMRQYQQQYQQQQQMPGAGAYGSGMGGYQQRMAMQQQNPMQGYAAPAPAAAPAPTAPTAPVTMQQRVAAPYAAPAPVQAAPAPQAMAPRPMAAYAPQMSAAQTRAPMGTATTPALTANPVQHALTGGATQGLAMSDATQKVLSQPSLADAFLAHMKPYSYRYKDPSMEPRVSPTGGTYLGVMAQDLEKVPHIGPQLVVDTPHGKMVDQKTALSATMAGLARVNERLSAVEHDLIKRGK